MKPPHCKLILHGRQRALAHHALTVFQRLINDLLKHENPILKNPTTQPTLKEIQFQLEQRLKEREDFGQ